MIPNNHHLARLILVNQLERLGYCVRAQEDDFHIKIDFRANTEEDFIADYKTLRSPLRLAMTCGERDALIQILSTPRTREDHANGREQAGRLIGIEGLDGTGKTTIARALEWRLYHLYGVMAHYTTAISDSSTDLGLGIGGLLRAKATWNWEAPSPRAEQLAILTARVDQWDNIILPALRRGVWVISDRFNLSGRIYKRTGQKLRSLYWVERAYDIDVEPDVNFILDLPVDHPRRLNKVQPKHDRLERGGVEFWENARAKFIEYSKHARSHLIDAEKSEEEIVDEIVGVMVESGWLPRKGAE